MNESRVDRAGLVLLAKLVDDAAGCFAGGLAGGLAFAAAVVLDVFCVIACLKGDYSLLLHQ